MTVDRSLPLPLGPSIVVGHGHAAILTPDGELLRCSVDRAAAEIRTMPPPMLVHAPSTYRRLGMRPSLSFDLLELFAFVHPARPSAPTPRGLCKALEVQLDGDDLEAAVVALPELALAMLGTLRQGRDTLRNRDASALASYMARAGWGWAPYINAALGRTTAASNEPLKIWKRLPEWEETAPPLPPSGYPVSEAEARGRLASMLGPEAEQRPGQGDYAGAVSAAFAPREVRGDPHIVLAEAGTGTGKTAGYLAPASVWAERNKGSVWISTYTRHLQRQIDSELERSIPDAAERRKRVVLRKGRENYLCLLNFEEAVNSTSPLAGAHGVFLGLVARWAMATSDGDIQSGDLPGWLAELHGQASIAAIADRRGECIHSACPYWKRCFVEHTIRRARTAELVVANHALVMAQAAWGGLDDGTLPTRYVFDEGHHLFEAADSAFSAVLSGAETAELRRWLLGAEGGRSRSRGLRRRVEDLIAEKPELEAPLDAMLQAARALAGLGWRERIAGDVEVIEGLDGGANPTEGFLRNVRRIVLARTTEGGDRQVSWGNLECDVYPLDHAIVPSVELLTRALQRLVEPATTFSNRLAARLDTEAEDLDVATRTRIEAICRSLKRRVLDPVGAWQGMLRSLVDTEKEPETLPTYTMFFQLDRRDEAVDVDVGLHRHWLDPTIPFATTLATPSHGMVITSATLRDSNNDDAESAWEVAESRVGANHLPSPAVRVAVSSPFDYDRQTRVIIVTDVGTGNLDRLAAAYRALFLASGGGALGLFTAIRRLRGVHQRIASDLEAASVPLYAQHVDAMGNATLIDVFRSEEDSCLLGTDAMRDGVDVPGHSLRLVVFEKVPWPRPDILHRERRTHLSFGDPKGFDDRVARLRLRQAFGRLIRSANDRGVFVLLDRQTPSRLLTAFPEGVAISRVGLAEAVRQVRQFFALSDVADVGS